MPRCQWYEVRATTLVRADFKLLSLVECCWRCHTSGGIYCLFISNESTRLKIIDDKITGLLYYGLLSLSSQCSELIVAESRERVFRGVWKCTGTHNTPPHTHPSHEHTPHPTHLPATAWKQIGPVDDLQMLRCTVTYRTRYGIMMMRKFG